MAEYTVVREMGHGLPAMVRRIYGHLGTVRHRSEAVEYRVEHHRAATVRDGVTVEVLLAGLTERGTE